MSGERRRRSGASANRGQVSQEVHARRTGGTPPKRGPIRESCSTVESLALTPQTNHHNKETIMDETTRPLTAKQQQFCCEYIIDLNATAAARRAGYSSRTAEQQGYQLLQNPSVQAEIQRAISSTAHRVSTGPIPFTNEESNNGP